MEIVAGPDSLASTADLLLVSLAEAEDGTLAHINNCWLAFSAQSARLCGKMPK